MEELFEEKLSVIRELVAMEGAVTDEEVKELVVFQLFKDERCAALSFSQLDMLADRIFFRIRSRLGILQPLMDDPEITEIMANGPENIFIEKRGQIKKSPYSFGSVEEMEDVMRNIAAFVHKEFNEMNPIVDARLEDGSRVNCVHRNIALNGPVITVRKFSDKYMTMKDLVAGGTVNETGCELLACLVGCGYNIFVSGGTSTRQDYFS